MTSTRRSELLPLARFLRLVSRLNLFTAVVGDQYAVLVVEIDVRTFSQGSHDEFAGSCMEILTGRVQDALPRDAIVTRLHYDAFGIIAFGAKHEAQALALARTLHDSVRAPIALPRGELILTAGIGVAFTGHHVTALEAMQEAEGAVTRVRLNGGDATYVASREVQYAATAGLASGNGAGA